MHDSFHFDSSTPGPNSVPTSIVCYANLKYLYVTCERSYSFHDALLQHLHLPGLQNLYVEQEVRSPEPLLSFLQETQGLVSLSLNLKRNFGQLGTLKREMYTLFPALKSFTLGHAEREDLAILSLSPHSKLCPALHRLILHNFALAGANDARVIEDFSPLGDSHLLKLPIPVSTGSHHSLHEKFKHEYCFNISSILPPGR